MDKEEQSLRTYYVPKSRPGCKSYLGMAAHGLCEMGRSCDRCPINIRGLLMPAGRAVLKERLPDHD